MEKRKVLGICLFGIILVSTLGYMVESGLINSVSLLVVLSDSMSPTIKMGDLVLTTSINPSKVKEGDIITYTKRNDSNSFVTHRVIEVINQGNEISFKTKGDANEDADIRIIPSSNLKGKVLFSIPYGGYFVRFIRTPIGFIMFIIVPAGLIIVGEVKNILESVRK